FVRNFRPDNAPTMRGSQIRGLVIDHDRRFWIGYTGQGLQYFDWPLPQDGSAPTFFTVPGTESFYIQNLRVFGDSLWVLTTSELRRYSARTAQADESNVFSPPAETAQNAVRPLEVGPDGAVWLGTENGLRVYHPGGAIEDFKSTNSPLVNDAIRAIVVEPRTGVAWIGTASGLNRYDPHYVPVQLAPSEDLRIRVFPNPMTLTAIGTPIRLSGNAGSYSGEVYDLNGRRVARYSDVKDDQVFWNGLDDHGNAVKPGVYFVRAVSQGRSATARIVLVR
ncbi:MAG TPA: T9SS type A sorting domain-containing protein, partial [Candidatus Eisenbacteria bacterium]